jgi:hypothetical protein
MKNLFYMAFAMTFTSLPVGAFEMTETGKFQSIVTVKAESEVLLIDIFPLTQCVEKNVRGGEAFACAGKLRFDEALVCSVWLGRNRGTDQERQHSIVASSAKPCDVFRDSYTAIISTSEKTLRLVPKQVGPNLEIKGALQLVTPVAAEKYSKVSCP